MNIVCVCVFVYLLLCPSYEKSFIHNSWKRISQNASHIFLKESCCFLTKLWTWFLRCWFLDCYWHSDEPTWESETARSYFWKVQTGQLSSPRQTSDSQADRWLFWQMSGAWQEKELTASNDMLQEICLCLRNSVMERSHNRVESGFIFGEGTKVAYL